MPDDSRNHGDGDDVAPEVVEARWEAEIARRIARFDSGETRAIPAEDVFARLEKIAPDQ